MVEDDDGVREVAAKLFTGAGYRVAEAESAERALVLIDEHDIDLVVSEVGLPGLSGLELIDELAHRGHDIPIVLTSSQTEHAQRERAIERGAHDLITKPWRFDQLANAVAAALSNG